MSLDGLPLLFQRSLTIQRSLTHSLAPAGLCSPGGITSFTLCLKR